MPGIPDVYQGTELWEDSLVDPDNRRPVDFDLRQPDAGRSGRPATGRRHRGGQALGHRRGVLRLRRAQPELFTGYRPLTATGPAAAHLVGFDRGGALTLATRLPVTLTRTGGWGDTGVDLGGSVVDVLTGDGMRAGLAWPTCSPPIRSPCWSASEADTRQAVGLHLTSVRPIRG